MGKSEDLFELAKNDAKVAKILLNLANDELMQNTAAYHIEQAFEKILKSIIVDNGGQAGITHSIMELSKDLEEMNINIPEWVKENDDEITAWSTTIRYNANFKADHDIIEKVISLTENWIKELEQRK